MPQRSCRLFHVDAFTRERFCGNPAIVVLDASCTEQLVTDFDITPEPVLTSSGRTTKVPVPTGPLPTPRLIERPFKVLPTTALQDQGRLPEGVVEGAPVDGGPRSAST